MRARPTTGLASRLGTFVAERHPLALEAALDAFNAASRRRTPRGEQAIDTLRPLFRRELARRLKSGPVRGLGETTPRTSVATRLAQAHDEIVGACDGFLRRAAKEAVT